MKNNTTTTQTKDFMDSTIIDKVHSTFNTVLKAYYDAYETYYGGDYPKGNRSQLSIEVEGKGVALSNKGYTLQSLSNPMPILDLTKDTLILKVDLYVSLEDVQERELYFHHTDGFIEVARGVGLDDLLLKLSRITPNQLAETLFLPSDLEDDSEIIGQ